jgi:hypothetical protein
MLFHSEAKSMRIKNIQRTGRSEGKSVQPGGLISAVGASDLCCQGEVEMGVLQIRFGMTLKRSCSQLQY